MTYQEKKKQQQTLGTTVSSKGIKGISNTTMGDIELVF